MLQLLQQSFPCAQLLPSGRKAEVVEHFVGADLLALARRLPPKYRYGRNA